MTEDRIDQLPKRLEFSIAALRSHPAPPEERAVHRMVLSPGRISGWGSTTTIGGNGVPSMDVDVVAMNGRICLIWKANLGGNCEQAGTVRRRGISQTVYDDRFPVRFTSGLVSDEVASLRLNRPGFGRIPVHDNVFQLNGGPSKPSFLIGRNRVGEVVTKIYVPGAPSGWEKLVDRAIKRWQRNPVGPPPQGIPSRR